MALPLLEKFILNEEIRLDNKPKIKLVQENNSDDMIDDIDQIENALNKLQKQHTLFTAYINGKNHPCSSVLLETNREEQYLVIDEFCPKEINRKIAINDTVNISGSNAGVTINFSSKILAIAEQNDNPYYKIPFPQAIEYCQRRETHRVPVGITDPVKVVFVTEDNVLLHGELRDISIGGFSARLNHSIIEDFQPGDKLPKCILQMPKGSRIVSSVEIRRKFVNVGSGLPMMGVMFTNINKQDRRVLQQYIAKLERDLMKHMKR